MNKRFKPQYLPYNDDAHALVEALAVELGLSLKGITGAKHKTILASFLYCVQEAGVGAYLDWSGGTTSQDTTGFSFFPATGASTVVKVRTKLVEAGYVILIRIYGCISYARLSPADGKELMEPTTNRDASETSILIALMRCPCLMIHGLPQHSSWMPSALT